ncbi:polymer-forming cytoskeletal protein [Halosimplex aquaticum]|uniref:Polymer-forming cytoskeletal protein n=1 Tax=Halosimplex aquaticum TaxID=3026162 RepID=A0ABD5Y0S9_9EURY|nr:polymer-forming cytoskeletal protein [Halosimplex aquaticum]
MAPPTPDARTSRAIVLVCSLVVALALLPGAAAAAPQDADRVVGPNETVGGDLTAMTGDVLVRGTVEGDVTAVAGSVEVADGGRVDGDVTAASGSVTVAGSVGGDATAASGSVELTGDARVEGSASAGSGSVTVAEGATVEEDISAGGGDAEVAGTVDGDVASGQSVVLGSTATVGGDVTYHESLDREDGAAVAGTVTEKSSSEWHVGGQFGVGPDEVFDAVFSPLLAVYWTLLSLLVGAVLLALFPEFSAELVETATDDPARTGAAGLAALFAVPVLLVAVTLTIVGIPLALAGGALFWLAAWAALVYGEYLVGRYALTAADVENRWAALVAGVVGVEAVGFVPYVGGLVTFVVLLLGLGAGALVVAARWRGDGDDGVETPPPDPSPRAA